MKGSLVHKLFKARGIGKNMAMISVPLKPKAEKLTSFWKKLKPWQKGGVIGIIFGIAIEALKYTTIPFNLNLIAGIFSAGPGTLFLLAIDFPTTHNTLSPILRLYLPILLSGITVLFYSLLGMALMPMYDRIKRANKCRSIVFVAVMVILLFLGSVFTMLRFFDSSDGWEYSCYKQCVSKAHQIGLKWDSSADSIFCKDIYNGNSLRDIATSLMNKIRGIDKKCLNFFSEENITVARAFSYLD